MQYPVTAKLPRLAWLTVLLLAALSLLAAAVVAGSPLAAFDQSLAGVATSLRSPTVVSLFLILTALGQPLFITTVVALTSLWLAVAGRRALIAGLLLTSIGAATASSLGKLAFARPRPADALLQIHSYSFPSGHATLSMAVYGYLGWLMVRRPDQCNRWAGVWIATPGLVLLIGFSRIVLGVHYASDVLGGFLLGALWLLAGVAVATSEIACRECAAASRSAPLRQRYLLMLLAFVTLVAVFRLVTTTVSAV